MVMRLSVRIGQALAMALVAVLVACNGGPVDDRPNILLVLADDMGWTDLHAFGSNIDTPNLDRLAESGMVFTDFHTSVSCSPTRSMLLTGTDNHLAGLGNMHELLTPEQQGHPGYEGYLSKRTVTFAEVLRDAGYHTIMAGKWHLGQADDQLPGRRGFYRSFSMLVGAAGHYHEMVPVQAPDIVEYSVDGEKIAALSKDFYSSRSYADFVIEAIREQHGDGAPFLAYLAFTAPHDPLHVPEPWQSKYRDAFDDGYEALKQRRIRGAKERGLIPADAPEIATNPAARPWLSLSAEEQALESRTMEVYAGMVANLDYHYGRVVDFLNDIGELENTIIIFLSDNGPNPWYNYQYPGNVGTSFLDQFDNSPSNIGNPTSHVAYGPGWASASAGPLDYFKMTVGEGGIRSPTIIAGPGIASGVNGDFAYVTDIMPTMLELASADHPTELDGQPVLPMRGRSLVPLLTGAVESVYRPGEYVGGEMLNGKWMRRGDFKAVLVTEPYGPGEWQLYDVVNDPGETSDLSDERPDLLEELKEAWRTYANEVGVLGG